jgi:hypothetical protein
MTFFTVRDFFFIHLLRDFEQLITCQTRNSSALSAILNTRTPTKLGNVPWLRVLFVHVLYFRMQRKITLILDENGVCTDKCLGVHIDDKSWLICLKNHNLQIIYALQSRTVTVSSTTCIVYKILPSVSYNLNIKRCYYSNFVKVSWAFIC